MKNEIRELQHFRNEQTNKTSINSHQDKTEIFCDSFFKYVDKRRCLCKHTEVIINHCFTLDDIIIKLMNREKDELVNKVALQCGFYDFVQNKRKATQVFDNMQHFIQLFREIFLYPIHAGGGGVESAPKVFPP